MGEFNRITQDPAVMSGKPCIRGMRVTVSTVISLVASGHSVEKILDAYPYLEREDIAQALRYAAWRVSEQEIVFDKVYFRYEDSTGYALKDINMYHITSRGKI